MILFVFLDGFVLFCLRALYHKERPQLWWSIWAKTNWAALLKICSKIGHSYEAFTCLFCRNISTRLSSANRNSSANLLKLGVTSNVGKTQILLTRSIENLQVLDFSLIDLSKGPVVWYYPLLQFQNISRRIAVCREKTSGDISATNYRYMTAPYEWPIL